MAQGLLILSLSLTCLGLGCFCVFLWRTRRHFTRGLATLNREILAAAEEEFFVARVSPTNAKVAAIGQLGESVALLFEALADKDRQMRQRETLFQDLANTLPDVVLVHRDRVIFANNAAGLLMGLTSEQLTGRLFTDLVRPLQGDGPQEHCGISGGRGSSRPL